MALDHGSWLPWPVPNAKYYHDLNLTLLYAWGFLLGNSSAAAANASWKRTGMLEKNALRKCVMIVVFFSVFMVKFVKNADPERRKDGQRSWFCGTINPSLDLSRGAIAALFFGMGL